MLLLILLKQLPFSAAADSPATITIGATAIGVPATSTTTTSNSTHSSNTNPAATAPFHAVTTNSDIVLPLRHYHQDLPTTTVAVTAVHTTKVVAVVMRGDIIRET